MKALRIVLAALSAGSVAAVATAEPTIQPPMNDFNFAFYTCDGGAFQISYDSDTPTEAKMTTSDHNKQYVLERKPATDGVQFSGPAAKFWTDGKKVVVEGTTPPMRNCKIKSN
jgi:membrane-bound inhibitor of C-type lysozyme